MGTQNNKRIAPMKNLIDHITIFSSLMLRFTNLSIKIDNSNYYIKLIMRKKVNPARKTDQRQPEILQGCNAFEAEF